MFTRPGLIVLHRRAALIFAPLLLLQAFTGSALLFRAELARAIDPAAMVRQSPAGDLPVSILIANAAKSLAGFHVTRLFQPATASDTAFAQLVNVDGATRYAALDPGSGKVLATGTVWRFPLETALQLHYRLMDARLGLAVILANALALTFLAFTGLAFWWPGRKRIIKSLEIRGTAPARLRLRQWHRSAGVLLSAVILFSATTGALLVIPDLTAPSGIPGAPPAPGPVLVDQAVAQAQRVFPGARLRDIRFPSADRIDVNFFAPERNSRAVHVVSVSLSGGTVLKRIEADDNPVLWMTILPLHTGDSLGLAGRLLLLAEALILVFIGCSGPLMWWQARRAKRKVR